MIPFFTRPDLYLHLGTFPLPQVVNIRISDAPDFMIGLRVLFLSDIHLRPNVSDEKLSALIELIARQKADVILLGGDYAETDDDFQRFFRAFKGLCAPLGAFAAVGNNDFISAPILRDTLHSADVRLLQNECVRLDRFGGSLEIAGCDDHKYGAPRTDNLFSQAPAYRILLSHFPVSPNCRCDLMLSGHTHAGQCNFLGITPYSLFFERKYRLLGVRGLQQIGDMRLLIGNGIGVSRFPIRLGAQPHIYLLKFTGKDFC